MNFDKVGDAQGASFTLPGTIGIFTIKSVEKKSNTNGKEYLTVTFEDSSSSFKHMLYWTEKALPRIQHLYKHANGGTLLTGEVTIEQAIAGLQGKKVGLKVVGRIGTNGQSYPDLGFGGFASDPNEEAVKKLVFGPAEQRSIDIALANNDNQGQENADSETTAPETNSDAASF